MTQHRIDPGAVTTPIQLLAAWFVALILLDSAFLAAASILNSPSWLPIVLVFAAVLNVPVFLICMFLLQTRFRPELQSDKFYSDYLKEKQNIKDLASRVQDQMNEAGLDLPDLVLGNSLTVDAINEIRPIVEELKIAVEAIQVGAETSTEIDPASLRALAQGELAIGNWLAAANILDDYANIRRDDFEANFSRGVAYANTRQGKKTNMKAFLAYNDAVAFMPDSIDPNFRARLFVYRGAMLKRIGRYMEALADLKIAEVLATKEYETNDIRYNLASVYALQGDRKKMMNIIRHLDKNSRILPIIRAHLGDYFSGFADDEEFLQIIGAK